MPTTSSFLPKDYSVSTGGSDFFKLKNGENKFRILTNAVVGKEGWKDNRPFRRGGVDAVINADECDVDQKSGKPKINDFMAFMVYSYNDEKIMIAEFTQTTIKKAIAEYANDEDWQSPLEYDLTVSKTGEGLLTKYSVKPSPAKPLKADVQKIVSEAEPSFDLITALSIDL
jgi:hypothetical protein